MERLKSPAVRSWDQVAWDWSPVVLSPAPMLLHEDDVGGDDKKCTTIKQQQPNNSINNKNKDSGSN